MMQRISNTLNNLNCGWCTVIHCSTHRTSKAFKRNRKSTCGQKVLRENPVATRMAKFMSLGAQRFMDVDGEESGTHHAPEEARPLKNLAIAM